MAKNNPSSKDNQGKPLQRSSCTPRDTFREHLKGLRDKAHQEAKGVKAKSIMAKVWSDDYPIVIEW